MTRSIYRIEHTTQYVHAGRVSTSQHLACLMPRSWDRQTVHDYALDIEPAASELVTRTDYFGNVLHQFEILTPYLEMRAVSRAVVEVRSRAVEIDADASAPWEDVRDAAPTLDSPAAADAVEYRYASPYVALDPELAAFAAPSFQPRRPFVAGAIDLMRRIHDEFTFDATATTITTPITRVLADRQGVCQDFAHLQIGCLRALGLPARYISGYLLTDPPPGQPRLVGADASHAWLSVSCPRLGWIDLDPTNNAIPDVRHVTIAWGRDYGDVSPLRGIVLGGERQRLHVGVSVTPVDFC